MLKLLKYEFRKSRTGLLVMLGIASALFAMAPLGKWIENETLLVLSPALLAFYALAAYIFVLAKGIGAYSSELKNRTGYLLLMTPHSPVTILYSKLIFTLFFALVMIGICILAMIGSGSILLGEIYEIKGFFNALKLMLADTGIQLTDIGYTMIFFLAEILGAVLFMVSIAYFSVTLSATLLSGKRGRGFVSCLAFVLVYALITRLLTLALPADFIMLDSMRQVLAEALPLNLAQLALAIGFTALSGIILKKWVSL